MSYTVNWDMEDTKRGDTIKSFALTLSEVGVGVITPSSVCCQFRDRNGNLAHTYEVLYEPTGRLVFPRVEPETTREWVSGIYKYDVEFTLPDGKVRTYLSGTIRILEDVSRCHS